MVIEKALTAFLKYKYAHSLTFDQFTDIEPPKPEQGKEYLLYVHIPFCEELCPYCSFNRYPFDEKAAREYFQALNREIELYGERGFNFTAVYVGGGTPTVLPEAMFDLLKSLKKSFDVGQISLETNPNHLTPDIMRLLKEGGVNRLSVGVQSFDNGLLKQMERFHKYGSGEEIAQRLAELMGYFDTLNVDMIFNFPTQTQAMLLHDLQVIKDISADQVTFYPLMISDITRKELAQRFGPLSYETEKRFYDIISDALDKDYSCGTAWCFSRKKSLIDEYIVDYDEYVGVGSGSFGYANGACFANTFSLKDYTELVHADKFPLLAKKSFTLQEQAQYEFTMKLFGVTLDVAEAERKFNGKFRKLLRKELSAFRAIGALEDKNGKLRLTRKGRYLWVIIMREFFTGVNNFRDVCRAPLK